MDHWLRTHVKAYPRQGPRDAFLRPQLTSHAYGWRGQTLEKFGRITASLK